MFWIAESVSTFMSILAGMSSLAIGPVVLLLFTTVITELLVFDILETIDKNYDYYIFYDVSAGNEIKRNTAVVVIMFLLNFLKCFQI